MRTENDTVVYKLGTIEVSSGKILVSDPCYLDGAHHMFNFIEGCKTGTWTAEATVSDEGDWGKRVAILSASHEEPSYTGWSEVGIAGVDSGQMSIMDAARLAAWEGDDRVDGWEPDEHAGEFNYQGACEITLRDGVRGGILSGCMAVSSSGYGDGAYPVFVARNRDGEVVAVKVEFIWDEEDEEIEETDEDS